MSNQPEQDFDPRFNPAFQRGFAGAPDAEAAVAPETNGDAAQFGDATLVHAYSPPPARADSPVPPSVPAAATAPRRTMEQPEATSAQPAATEPDASIVSVFDVEQQTATEPGQASRLSGRNPFLLVLAAVAVLLVGIGAWVFNQARSGFDDTANIQSQGDFLSLQAMIAAAPSIVLLGVATGIGVLFVFAAHWRGKR